MKNCQNDPSEFMGSKIITLEYGLKIDLPACKHCGNTVKEGHSKECKYVRPDVKDTDV